MKAQIQSSTLAERIVHILEDLHPAKSGAMNFHSPSLGEAEALAVRECLESGWVSTAGPQIEKFEKLLSDYVGLPHAITTMNGTSALHLAMLGLGVGPEDEVMVPDLTFIAPVNAAKTVNAMG